MYNTMQAHPLATAVCAVAAIFIARFLITAYHIRSRAHKLPGPPHSWIFGHLLAMNDLVAEVPRRVHPHVLLYRAKEKWSLPDVYFVDLWPLDYSIIPVTTPKLSQQITVEKHTGKASSIKFFLDMLVGKNSMVATDGHEWKQWRQIFNAGFAAQHLMSLVPGIVDDGLIWIDGLMKHATDGTVVRLEDATTRLTVDIIGRVALDVNFDTQRQEHPCVTAMRAQAQLIPNEGALNPLYIYYPWVVYARWRNHRIQDKFIGNVLNERFAAKERDAASKERKRTILDLALDSYLAGEAKDDSRVSSSEQPQIDAVFKKGLIVQIRTFLFAGHDTTSSAICYALYELSRNPQCLERIRREHDVILGSTESTPDIIRSNPAILNKLDYTNAVVKEAMRLWPPGSTLRAGAPSLTIENPDTGEVFATEDYIIWGLHYGTHRNPDVWGPAAAEFEPERFMPENLHRIPEGAYRPFEYGPRNCIGQNLAMLESRIMLALVCRRLDLRLAIDRLRELSGDGSFWAADRSWRTGRQDLDGEEMYQVLLGTAKPREGMPVSVHKANWKV